MHVNKRDETTGKEMWWWWWGVGGGEKKKTGEASRASEYRGAFLIKKINKKVAFAVLTPASSF